MKQFFIENRQKLLKLMPSNSLALFFASEKKIRKGDSEYPFVQNSNFYYLTGYDYPGAILLMHRSEQKFSILFFSSENSDRQTTWTGYKPTLNESRDITGIENCLSLKELQFELYKLLPSTTTCYIDYPIVQIGQTLPAPLDFADQFKLRYPHIMVRRADDLLSLLRRKKHPWEIENIKNAIEVTKHGIISILKHVKAGLYEYELDAFFKFELNKRNCPVAFNSIIATGENATILHYSSNTSRLNKNDLVLLDLGAEYKYYSADISRTIPVKGTFSPFQKDIYEIVLQANKEIIKTVRPGITLHKLHQKTCQILAEGLIDLHLIKNKNDIFKYFYHGVSHSLGLDTHDVLIESHRPLEAGEIITVEPGLYIKEKKLGIRIEDDVLVTETGQENLSENIPKEIHEIEEIMQMH